MNIGSVPGATPFTTPKPATLTSHDGSQVMLAFGGTMRGGDPLPGTPKLPKVPKGPLDGIPGGGRGALPSETTGFVGHDGSLFAFPGDGGHDCPRC